jgi:hypothetical protein
VAELKDTISESQEVQILLKVPPEVKEKAQQQADLAFQYGWIESSTLKQLFVWLITNYLDAGIKSFIKARREKLAEQKT